MPQFTGKERTTDSLSRLTTRLQMLYLDRLQGGIAYGLDGLGIYLPVDTALLISGVITLIVWLMGVMKR